MTHGSAAAVVVAAALLLLRQAFHFRCRDCVAAPATNPYFLSVLLALPLLLLSCARLLLAFE